MPFTVAGHNAIRPSMLESLTGQKVDPRAPVDAPTMRGIFMDLAAGGMLLRKFGIDRAAFAKDPYQVLTITDVATKKLMRADLIIDLLAAAIVEVNKFQDLGRRSA